MAPTPAFDDNHRDILRTATHVTTWQQSDLVHKRARVVAAVAEYRKEKAILKRLKLRTDEKTQTLRNEMSTQEAVLQTYETERVTDLKRKADDLTVIAEKITELVRQKAEYEACRSEIDEEFDRKAAARNKLFDADTAKQNNLNDEMVNAERHHEVQHQFVTGKRDAYEELKLAAEQADFMVEASNEHFATQVIEVLNRLPPDSWHVNRRRGSGTGKRDIREDVVRLITSMSVNPGPRNKTEHWDSVNKSSHNQVSSSLFQVCVNLKVMITETSRPGTVRYELHPEFLEQLDLKPRARKFQKVQRWHINRDNDFLHLLEDRETEYQTHRGNA